MYVFVSHEACYPSQRVFLNNAEGKEENENFSRCLPPPSPLALYDRQVHGVAPVELRERISAVLTRSARELVCPQKKNRFRAC